MIVRKPMILYYDNEKKKKRKSIEKALSHMNNTGAAFLPASVLFFCSSKHTIISSLF